MTYAVCYWILMLLLLLAGGWWGLRAPAEERWPFVGWSVLYFLLFLVVGLKLFGAPLQGG